MSAHSPYGLHGLIGSAFRDLRMYRKVLQDSIFEPFCLSGSARLSSSSLAVRLLRYPNRLTKHEHTIPASPEGKQPPEASA
jgi:hypothetical protein